MATLVTSYQVQVYLGSAWVDITTDIISPIRSVWGIAGIGPSDRIASTGVMTFTLHNINFKYLPNSPTAHVDWHKGTPVRFLITYDGAVHTRFRGFIDSMKPNIVIGADGSIAITVLDWMDIASRSPVINPAIQLNRTSDETLTSLLPYAPIQPQALDFAAGSSIFPAIFDGVRSNTVVYSEMTKIAISELGYIYLRKDPVNGETLVFESRESRHALRTPTPIPVSLSSSDYLVTEISDFVIAENGDFIMVDSATTAIVENEIEDVVLRYGEHMINRMTVKAYPKRADTVEQVLFKSDKPIKIKSGQTLEISGRYVDPSGGGTPVNAVSETMVNPVATTDYVMVKNKDGVSNLTASLNVSVVYGSEGPTYTLKNNSSFVGRITKLQARGYGIYNYSPIEAVIEDNTSIAHYGFQNADLHQQYQDEPIYGLLEAEIIVERESAPRTILTKIVLNPNVSADVLQLQLYADIGDLVQIKFDKLGIDGLYYIQGIEMEMKQGKILRVAWTVIESFSLISGLSLLSIDVAESSKGGVEYGNVPEVFDIPSRTMVARIKPRALAPLPIVIGGPAADSGGTLIYCAGGTTLHLLYYTNTFDDYPGAWWAATAMPIGQWSTVAVSHNPKSISDTPVMYINGVESAVTQIYVPLGELNEEDGNLTIGNWHTVTRDWDRPFNGEIADFRIYNRILTAAEVLAYHNDSEVNDGLVFQGPCVRTAELSNFINVGLSGKKTVENIYGSVGIVNDNPIGRTAP